LGVVRDLCMRSACQGVAEVLVVMDVTELTFTLHELAEVDGPGAVVLCSTHLDRLVAPVGWRLVDERGGAELIPLPERPPTLDEAVEESTVRDEFVPELRPVAAVHPLEVARAAHEAALAERAVGSGDGSETDVGPDSESTPLLARAFLGVDRKPLRSSETGAGHPVDPFAEHAWDQSDVLDESEYTPAGDPLAEDPEFGEQLTFGGEPGA